MELDYFDYGQLDSFDSSLHSVSPVSLYTPSYNYLDTYDYNNYYTYHYPHRTVPPFLDTTTHRDHFRWKILNKEVRPPSMEERSTPPPFEEETTNKADYTGHVVMPQYYDEYAYSDYYYEPEKVPFVETTTHKREFTPKKVTVERRRTQSMEAARPHGIKMESDTTNRHDFTKKSSTCPASHLKLKNGRTENGHIYFVQRKNTGNKKR